MRHLCGNGIRQSQAAAWWDVVVRVNAAKHGKTTRGHYLGMMVLLGVWIYGGMASCYGRHYLEYWHVRR